jgi:hypothetical protein
MRRIPLTAVPDDGFKWSPAIRIEGPDVVVVMRHDWKEDQRVHYDVTPSSK